MTWYQDGLRFKCTQCGDCCTGAPGYVWVTNDEVSQLASAAGLNVDEFARRHVRKVGVRKSLRERANGDCVLLDSATRRCTAYEARPRQCRTWPFWDSNLRTPQAWQAACEACPGSGQGDLYQLQDIEAQRKAIRI